MSSRVATGLDVALEELPWGTSPVGLLTHDPARAGDGRPGRLALLQRGACLRRLFSPEHGLDANAREGAAVGMSPTPSPASP